MSDQALHPTVFEAMQAMTYTAPDATTDAQHVVRICEVDLSVRGVSYQAQYRFDLTTGNLRINIAESCAVINTAEFLGRLVHAIGERNAKAN